MAQNKKRNPRSNAAAFKKQAMERALVENALRADMANAFNRGLSSGYGTAVLVMFWLLHTVEHYGPKRCQRMVKEYQEYVRAHYLSEPGAEGEYQGLTIYEIAEMLKDEVGVDINPDTGFFKFEKPMFLGEEAEA